MRYDREHYFWEILVVLRKFLIVAATMAFTHKPVQQAWACIVLNAGALYMHGRVAPFLSFDALVRLETHREIKLSTNDRFEMFALTCSICLLGLGIFATQHPESDLSIVMIGVLSGVLFWGVFVTYGEFKKESEAKERARTTQAHARIKEGEIAGIPGQVFGVG